MAGRQKKRLNKLELLPAIVMDEFHVFRDRVNLIFVVDHAGRAGNGFFQTIFDQHPQVIACPWMHYVYSYILTEYGEEDQLDARRVWEHWRRTIYFTLLYNDLDDKGRRFVQKIGGDPSAEIDRAVVRNVFDRIVLERGVISRKDLIVAIFFSFALGLGRDIRTIRYIMCPDSISLRHESAMKGFSGKAVDFVVKDFPNARLIHLERDPRAGFASSNHQFVNQLGNMYGLKIGQFWSRLARLFRREFDWDSVFVFGFWLIYFRQTYKAIMQKRKKYHDQFLTVRNEDLNLNFAPTMKLLAGELGIEMLESWMKDFRPTMLGKMWTGTGAYNNQYQTSVYGPLENDPDSLARNVSGPNSYVTQRWRTRLKPNEIFLLEGLLASEIDFFGYEFTSWKGSKEDKKRLFIDIWFPLKGELPTLQWILKGRFVSLKDFFDRVFYLVAFPIFYVCTRMVFVSIVKEGNVFNLNENLVGKNV